MTDQTIPAAAPVENVGRGTLFALGAIPISIIAFAIVGGLGFISGIVAVIVPSVAGWLYLKGAGAPLSRKGWGPFILVSAAAVILGTFAGFFGQAYQAYTSVGGSGFGPALWTSLGNRITNGGADTAIALLIGLGLGAAGIFGVIRGGGKFGTATANNRLTPQQTQAYVAPDATPAATTPPPAAPPAPPAAPAPNAPSPAPNAPSPGVILNGKPVDPGAK